MSIFDDLQKIKEKLEIQEKRFTTITDYEGTITNYENFAESELKISPNSKPRNYQVIVSYQRFVQTLNH